MHDQSKGHILPNLRNAYSQYTVHSLYTGGFKARTEQFQAQNSLKPNYKARFKTHK